MTERVASSTVAGAPVGDARHACAFPYDDEGRAAGKRVAVDEVIRFHARVDHVLCQRDHAVICTDRLGQVSGDAVLDIIRSHPMVTAGGIPERNPFLILPEQFLIELSERRATERPREPRASP